MKKEIIEITEQTTLPKKVSSSIQGAFKMFLPEIESFVERAKDIEVTDPDDITGQKIARTLRLQGRQIRIELEKHRKELKEGVVERGRYIDSIAKVLKAAIVPTEERLFHYEKLKERKEAEERAEKARRLLDEFKESFPSYVADGYTVEDMLTVDKEELFAAGEEIVARKRKERLEVLRSEGLESDFPDAEIAALSDSEFDEHLSELKSAALEAYKDQAAKNEQKVREMEKRLRKEQANGSVQAAVNKSEKERIKAEGEDLDKLEFLLREIVSVTIPSVEDKRAANAVDIVAGCLAESKVMIQEIINDLKQSKNG